MYSALCDTSVVQWMFQSVFLELFRSWFHKSLYVCKTLFIDCKYLCKTFL